MKKYKHVIWDWNGTLLDDVFLCADIMNGILGKRNLPAITIDYYKSIFTFPVKDYYAKTGLDFEKETFDKLGLEFIVEYERRKTECTLYPGALDVLKKINELNIEQSILSAYSQHTLEEIVKYFKLDKFFIGLVGLDNVYAAGKMENGKKWIKELNHPDGSVLFIGDTLHDFEVANEIGADCIMISAGHQTKKTLETCGVPVFDNLNDLFAKIEGDL
ncbi:MAG: HAD family hydrolase [Melioribacteraceae bacterium]|nr:HAD family hydrolase [Melioribacteraceae bacterium]MCF8355355.1 HAD family hydrolase [Melioribacteraceae bacterium]MCF8395167.1 HAD family hydrolase [Melioribacteraceae bacterium]MCF8420264.1 HAD family hydrolase [Melioribacteraceae bacterium]